MEQQEQLIEQIKSLPETVLHIRRAAGGLGSVVIYTKIDNGIKAQSIWLGREYSVPMLQEYLTQRGAA